MTTPLDRSTTWPYVDGEPGEFSYARFSSPTVAEAERRLGALDGGHAVLFASGAAASTAVVLALLEPGQTIALAEGAYYGTGETLDELARWGLRHIEFDQTGAAARRRGPRLARGAVEPVPHDAGLRGGRETCGTRALRLDGSDAAARQAARARLRPRAALGHEVPRRARRRPRRRGRRQGRGVGRAATALPPADGRGARRRHRLAAAARARDARGSRREANGDGAFARGTAARAPGRRDGALPRLRRAPLLRRRRRRGGARGRDLDDAGREHDEPRRRHVAHRGARALGGRPRPARPPPAVGRARGRRSALGRPRAGARGSG